MIKEEMSTTIEMLGRVYQIKCEEKEIDSLQRAAQFLEDKMRNIRDSGKVLSIDRIAVLAALNIAHQYLALEIQNNNLQKMLEQRLLELQKKLETALITHSQMELTSD